ncbi:UDP-glucose/GDP-mannose dehydrogenase family protein [bacterium]|nr:UDP-glucose/GDP-mannose dehydrogenase family protein [bacterium]MBU3955518.1 UDP-glucose/GDP-mannose dehydrogenase family protein [bacterium]
MKNKKSKKASNRKGVRIAIVGSGYVGLVSGICFAEIGHSVICIDNNKEKIKKLKKGIIPIYEPGLAQLLKKNMKNGRLSFSDSIKKAVPVSEAIFIAVNTPPRPDGSCDLQYVEAVSREVALSMNGYKVIVEKSTVPAQTGRKIKQTVKIYNRQNMPFDVVSNPEFLKEGKAIGDFLEPDRIVIGVESKKAEELMRRIYAPIKAPLIVTNTETSELIKHASNSFLATKISFINVVANIAERVGADIKDISLAMGLDKRIGGRFLDAGIGFGGSCFPKDVLAFIHMARTAGIDFNLLKEVYGINERQRMTVIDKLRDIVWNIEGKKIAVWGLAFKPDTDDLRNAPAIDIVRELLKFDAQVCVYDPVAMDGFRKILGKNKNLKYASALSAVKGADALMLLTEWDEFAHADMKKVKSLMRVPALIDGRNLYDPERMKKLGFLYRGVGRL